MTDKPWLKFYDKGVPESVKPYPEKPLQQFLEESAARYPDHAAIQFKPSHQGFARSHLTYRELNDLSDRTGLSAAWLKQEADSGRLPCLLVGRRRMFDPVAVRAALAGLAAKSRVAPAEKEATSASS